MPQTDLGKALAVQRNISLAKTAFVDRVSEANKDPSGLTTRAIGLCMFVRA